MNKKHSINAVAAAILLAGTTAASAGGLMTSGHVDLGLGLATQSCDEGDDDCSADDQTYGLMDAVGRINVPFGENASVQFDLGMTDVAQHDPQQFDDYVYGAFHLAYRNPMSYSAGVFGLIGNSDGEGDGSGTDSDHTDDDDDQRAAIVMVGIEGQKYLGNTTLYGQLGYFDAEDHANSDVTTDAVFIRGVVRHFLNDDAMVSVDLSYMEGEENAISANSDDRSGWSWGARYQRKISNMPLDWFVSYTGTHLEDDDNNDSAYDDEVTEHTIMVGLRMNFGGSSMKERDRYGATFDTPDVGRWTAWSMDVVD